MWINVHFPYEFDWRTKPRAVTGMLLTVDMVQEIKKFLQVPIKVQYLALINQITTLNL